MTHAATRKRAASRRRGGLYASVSLAAANAELHNRQNVRIMTGSALKPRRFAIGGSAMPIAALLRIEKIRLGPRYFEIK